MILLLFLFGPGAFIAALICFRFFRYMVMFTVLALFISFCFYVSMVDKPEATKTVYPTTTMH